ncbi:hypothetical protein RE6C_05077 [Rhodopirellula europaea 6C]|uniref:Uncharacterized protein n=1 Tax=Rhodopirellula europaea 6C TaxID=1263867 RepID=M2AVY3_9BACT|nr:hypothetical protein RE6C_05077 [Rhodopirellula europaea 6C]
MLNEARFLWSVSTGNSGVGNAVVRFEVEQSFHSPVALTGE